MRRTLLVAVAAATAIAAAGCGAGVVRHDARVSGSVRFTQSATPGPGFIGSEPVAISILDAYGHVVASSRPSRDRFAFDLAPGKYTIVVKANGTVTATLPVTAVVGRTARENIVKSFA